MDRARRIAKNSVWALIARGIDILSNLILLAIIARYLGVANFGVYSVIIAIVWTISPFLILGLPRILARDIAQDKKRTNELIGSAITLIGLGAIPIFAVIVLYTVLFKIELGHIAIILIITGCVIIIAITRTLNSVFVAFEKMHYETIVALFISLISMLITGSVAYFDLGFIYIFVGLLIANFSGLVISVFLSLRYFAMKPELGVINRNTFSYLMKESIPLAVSQFFFQTYLYSGVFVLKLLSNNFDVGLFQAPYRTITRLHIIPMTVIVAVFPLLSQLSISDKDRLRSIVLTVLKLMLIVSLPLTIFGFVFADKVILFVFGEAFLGSTIALKIQILGLGLFFMNNIFESLFICLKKQRSLIVVMGIGLFISILLNVFLVPQYGYIGASIVTLISQTVILGMGLYFLSDIFNWYEITKAVYRPILSAFITGFFLYVFSGLNNIFIAGVGLLIYPVMLFIFNTFSQEEILFMKTVGGTFKWKNITNSNL